MSKWRPSEKNCIYVVPDIQGALGLFEKICARILPLRKSDGGKDMLILLGDFIDRHVDSHKTLDFLIDLKKKYPDQVVMIKGNHEQIFLNVMNLEPGKNLTLQSRKHYHDMWLANGGIETLMGYMDRAGIKDVSPLTFPQFRIVDIVPKEHIEFLTTQLVDYYKLDKYVFVHGGYNPTYPVEEHEPSHLYWDRDLIRYVQKAVNNNKPEDIFWNETIVTGHNGSMPYLHDKFMMLDAGSPRQLLLLELNSMEAFMAYPNKKRLVKYNLQKHTPRQSRPVFRRVDS
ncbi:MAG TPA: metallophosphoesterase [Anaerovoracaceae bacterium]|nr:metallophosphoesterase [Anaerovoracaceae bacterium]